MEGHVFYINIDDHRGHNRKVIAIYNVTKVNLQQMYSWTLQ